MDWNRFIEEACRVAKEFKSKRVGGVRIYRFGSVWQPQSRCVRKSPTRRGQPARCLEWQTGERCSKPDFSKYGYCKEMVIAGKTHKATNCTTYVSSVFKETFIRLNFRNKASATWQRRGLRLCKYLKESELWMSIFWCPDILTPFDTSMSHFTSYIMARKKGIYWPNIKKRNLKFKIDLVVAHYKPTNKARQSAWLTQNAQNNMRHRGRRDYEIKPEKAKHFPTGLKKAGLDPAKEQQAAKFLIEVIKRIRFGVIVANGGFHSGMLLSNKIYEVHWGREPGSANLYDNRATFLKWQNGPIPWGSGVILIPGLEWLRAQNQAITSRASGARST